MISKVMNGGGKVVCVTGASGYIGSWIVKLLLLRGYTVRATVRDPRDTKKTEHLLALEGANERLELFKADLLEEGSFEQAIDGCDGVFHIASPVPVTPVVTDPQTELIDPAVKGTLNVLKTCTRVSSVKRVIVASSMVAVVVREPPLGPNDLVDESCFSDPRVCAEKKRWYTLSKTLAEDAAWQFAKENRIDMVVIHPGLVVGPLLQPTLNFSLNVLVNLINGTNYFPDMSCRLVDVRDVAVTHIKAFETPSANGRYLIEGPIINLNDIAKILREFFPEMSLVSSNKNEPSDIYPVVSKVCVEKVKNLGVEFTPIETSLRETILSLKEKSLM